MKFSMTSIQVEKVQIDQVVSEFFSNTLNIILEARIPNTSGQNRPSVCSHLAATTTDFLKSSRSASPWFNLDVDSCTAATESAEPWRREFREPMVVDVLLQQPMGREIAAPSDVGPPFLKGNPSSTGNPGGDSWRGEEGCVSSGISRTLLERWVVQYVPTKRGLAGSENHKTSKGFGKYSPERCASSGTDAIKSIRSGLPLPYPSSHTVETPAVYKRAMIMLRSLYCTMRTLPAHRLFRLVNSSSHSRSFTLSYKVSSAPVRLSEGGDTAMMIYSLTPVETMWGMLCVSVAYRHTTAVTALEISPPILPRIIPDYVGSPATDPMRRFFNVGSMPGAISGRRGVHVVSLPPSLPSSPSDPSSARRHSWSGPHQEFPLSVFSTPSFRANRRPSPFHPPDSHVSPQMHASFYLTSSMNIPHSHIPQTSPQPTLQEHRVFGTACLVHKDDEISSLSLPIPKARQPMSFSPPPAPPNLPCEFLLAGELSPGGMSSPGSVPQPNCLPRAKLETSLRTLHAERPPLLPSRSQYPPLSPGQIIKDAVTSTSLVWTGPWSTLPVPSFIGRLAPHISNSAQAELSLPVSPAHLCSQMDDKDDGPPSGIKRSLYGSGRLINFETRVPKSFSQADARDEFSCPFAVDDDDPGDGRSRVESLQLKLDVNELEQARQWSQDAAAGALVRTLKSAPPLRRNAATSNDAEVPCWGPYFSLAVRSQEVGLGGREVKLGRPLPYIKNNSDSKSLLGSGCCQHPGERSSVLTSKSALEELKGYIEMTDRLRKPCGGKFQHCPPAKHI